MHRPTLSHAEGKSDGVHCSSKYYATGVISIGRIGDLKYNICYSKEMCTSQKANEPPSLCSSFLTTMTRFKRSHF